ncbi:hypothetical protein ACFV5N_09225, partial [Streptomyces sp. NPDC059853]|uniref:hypothetical protein n=1 Tax=Streptomyces sp. NPDC059853 TaxID=3346973 RepID=UPI00365F80F2
MTTLSRYARNPRSGAYHYGRDTYAGDTILLCTGATYRQADITSNPTGYGQIAPLAAPTARHTECRKCGRARAELAAPKAADSPQVAQLIKQHRLSDRMVTALLTGAAAGQLTGLTSTLNALVERGLA